MPDPPIYLPGRFPKQTGPLGRYLPPIPDGVGAAWLRQNVPAGSWVLDPFGASPRLVVEAARAGYCVLAAVNNPIARFLLELNANPPAASELRAALADLAVAQRAGERLEPHLRALYQTECAACGRVVEAQAFIWERGDASPSGRIYACPHCNQHGEQSAVTADAHLAERFASGNLHRARALERVAPMDDPDRAYVEEALSMYPPRAVYALFTLVNKLESFPAPRRRLLAALLLAALDQANVLWAHPAARQRPRQLVTPGRFLEKNVWLALEEAVEGWPASLPAPPDAGATLPLTTWPELPPSSGGICVYEGRLKDLATQVQSADLPPGAVLAALPRPNQAYWTLSALWAGWLWGHEASLSFHSVLRRRRYDWDWHSEALYSTLRSLAQIVPPGEPFLGLVGEVEPGFLSAALIAAEMAAFDLQGIALRIDEGQAQITWQRSSGKAPAQRLALPSDPVSLAVLIRRAALEHLGQRGEPAAYLHLHAAALARLAQERIWATGSGSSTAEPSPVEQMEKTDKALEKAFSPESDFTRYGTESRALDAGWWWSNDLDAAPGAGVPALALADRAEIEVVRALQKNPAIAFYDLDAAVCAAFPGLFTPEQALITECLHSYGEDDPPGSDHWRLHAGDAPAARRADLEMMKSLLVATGKRLGYQVETGEPAVSAEAKIPPRPPVCWRKPGGEIQYIFYFIASGVLSNILFLPTGSSPATGRQVVVLPGGRARLVEYKLRRDLRLAASARGWRFVKFRHLRRLASDDTLTCDNLEQRLDLDPLANQDPQTAMF